MDQFAAANPAAYVLPQQFGDRRDGGRQEAVLLLPRSRATDVASHKQWWLGILMFSHVLFLPNEIITTRITRLACAYCAGRVYAAADPYLDGLGAAGPGCSHRQLAVRPDRTSEPVACGAGIPRLTLHDSERPRCPAGTLSHQPFPCYESFVDACRRDKPIGTVKWRCGGRRWSLRLRGSDKTDKSDDPQQANLPSHESTSPSRERRARCQ